MRSLASGEQRALQERPRLAGSVQLKPPAAEMRHAAPTDAGTFTALSSSSRLAKAAGCHKRCQHAAASHLAARQEGRCVDSHRLLQEQLCQPASGHASHGWLSSLQEALHSLEAWYGYVMQVDPDQCIVSNAWPSSIFNTRQRPLHAAQPSEGTRPATMHKPGRLNTSAPLPQPRGQSTSSSAQVLTTSTSNTTTTIIIITPVTATPQTPSPMSPPS